MHAPAAIAYPQYPPFQGNGLSSRAPNGQRKNAPRRNPSRKAAGSRVTVITQPGSYGGYMTQEVPEVHRHKPIEKSRAALKAFASKNNVQIEGKNPSVVLDEVANLAVIHISREVELIGVLPRLITKHNWTNADSLIIANAIKTMATEGKLDCKFLVRPNNAKLIHWVTIALKSARGYERRTAHALPHHVVTEKAEASLGPGGSKLTSLRH